MKPFLLYVISFLAFFFTLKTTYSQVDLQISSTNSAPVIDGVIDPMWDEFESNQLNNILSGSETSNEDFSVSFKTIWDENNLYVLVDVTDDIPINDSGEIWKDDAVEIYIDINNDKLTTYGETDYQYTFRWNDDNISANGSTDNINFSIATTSYGYVLEVEFPWSTLALEKAEKGVLLGFDVHTHDDDDGGERDNKLSWFATEDQSYNNPSLFSTVQLTGEFVVSISADKPDVSVSHGFYNNPFDVTISTAIVDMQIYYTLDGSDPTNSETVQISTSPVVVRIDPDSKQNRGKTPGVVLRTAAKKEGYEFSEVLTNSYIFVNKVRNFTEKPGYDWPSGDYVNQQEIDLLIDPDVVNDPRYENLIEDALLQIPSFSIVTDNKNLFDPTTGIYVNALNRGLEWERPASVELINPDGSTGFQIDAGLRIRGGYSRNPFFRKHGFRLFFRSEYGDGKLNFPLFDDEGVKRFDKIDLRCSQNYSWSKGGNESPYCTFNRDVFSRDLQRDMGWEYTRSRYYHLYVNGLYWGLFQTQERSESEFAASYLGGNAEDYDVIKTDAVNGGIEANDGQFDAWRDIWNLCEQGFANNNNYNKLQGLDENGQRDESLPVLVDIDNLIDYMNVIFYSGNFDGPVSSFNGNKLPNNFYCIYNREDDEGFKFFAHDNEHTLMIDRNGPGFGLYENRVSIGESGHDWDVMVVNNFNNFQPQWLHHKLADNEEYRSRFADKSYKYYFNNGILTPEKTAELFINRTYEYDTALIAESARWGDVDGGSPRTKDDDWLPIIERTMNEFFPFRTDIVIDQLKYASLLSELLVPEFRSKNELIIDELIEINAGTDITIRNSNGSGSIKYTVDGSDPRLTGGSISASAVEGGNLVDLSILQSALINTRIYSDGSWSALNTLKIKAENVPGGIQITEIHYNPIDGETFSGSEFEFIELKNSGEEAINLKASTFNGIQYSFVNETVVNPGGFIVLVSSSYAFQQRYGFEPFGEYGGQLANGGERISLLGVAGDTIASVKYNDKDPWPTSADGLGFSIVPASNDLFSEWDDGSNWRASSAIGGTPGSDDANIVIPEILINEVLTNADFPMVDAVELYNPNDEEVNIGSWYLSDRDDTVKWQIPAGTTIPANGFQVFNKGHLVDTILNYSANEFGNKFSLNSHGDDIYLFSANNSGELTGYVHGYDFGDSDIGISFGRHIISTGKDHFVAMDEVSFGNENTLPKVGPVVINRLMYHPLEIDFEYIELKNISNEEVHMYEETSLIPWKVDGIGFDFPSDFSLLPGESVYLIESAVNPSDFRFRQNLDASLAIFNYRGKLSNSGEELTLFKSAPQYYKNDTLKSPYIRADKVKYNDNDVWPDADGNGYVLQRVQADAYGNDPASWLAILPSVTISNYPLASGIVGVSYQYILKASGGKAPFNWAISSGALPDGIMLNPTEGKLFGTPLNAGVYNFSIIVTDQDEITDKVEFELIVNENTVPIAVNDFISTSMNSNVSFDILANDIDNDGDRDNWELSVVNSLNIGTIQINNDQTITYFPVFGFKGTDEFTYRISDINGYSEAVLFIEVDNEIVSATLETRIAQSSDDATENINSGQVNLIGKRLDLLWNTDENESQLVAMRFQDIAIPNGTKIFNAYLQFTASKTYDYETVLYVVAEDEGNASTYNNTTGNISSRSYNEDNYVEWWPEPWIVRNESAEKQRTPDISGIVQNIVDKPEWIENNAIAFVFSGGGLRSAVSYDGNPEKAPILHIEYSDTTSAIIKPIANAGMDMDGEIFKNIVLDANDSYSLDGRILNYHWNMISSPDGSIAQFDNPFVVDPTFSPDQFGEYVFTLYVDNGYLDSEVDTLVITIIDELPIANAGDDQNRILGIEIVLNGSKSYDPENASISYLWAITEQPVSSAVLLANNGIVNPTFIADVEGIYTISLLVSDGLNQSEIDEVLITVSENQLPIAIAGEDETVYTGGKVKLNGNESYDPEEYTLSFNWKIISKPSSSTAVLSDTSDNKPTFIADVEGSYVIHLMVNDGITEGTADEITITAIQNSAPVANAGSDQTYDYVELVSLDGSASSDADGTELTYLWTFVTKPSGSSTNLSDASGINPTFAPDAKGLYTIRLVVSDGITTSFDDVLVMVNSTTSIVSFELDNSMKVYPNPFSGKLFVEMDNFNNEEITFELYTISGVLVEKIEHVASDAKHLQLDFNKDRIRNGMYLLVIKSTSRKPDVVRVSYRNMQ